MKKTIFKKPPTLTGRQIKALRKKWELSQRQFAQALNLSVKTIQSWEQHPRKKLEGPVLRLIQVLKADVAMQNEDYSWREFNRCMLKEL
jgi:DNA-binding transcriptional regulator YiaG